MPSNKGRIGADIGGTFTDIVLETAERRHSVKLLTTYDAPERALLDGIALLLAEAELTPADIDLVVHGTTLATNALIERRGVKTALLTTAGMRDVLELGTESRFDQYDITMDKPPPLIPRAWRLGVPERMAADGTELLALDEDAVRSAAAEWRAAGIESVAIAFIHAYANPAHEKRAAEILAEEMPGLSFSLSSEVSPEMREYERFSTTAANAYVQPLVAHYLRRLDDKLRALGFDCPFFLMLSSGGLTTVETAVRFPVRLVESGPAGGAIFASRIAAERDLDRVLALDVGGTTAKICLIDKGQPRIVSGFEVARMHRFRKGSGLPLRIPVVEMVEIGAGGGSIASADVAGRLQVGPHSAGSEPGPAAYGRGGTRPTVTDADIVLGRIDPASFAGGKVPLDPALSAAAMVSLGLWDGDAAELAVGISEIVDETMASAARVHAAEEGTTLEGRTLIAFGGAAPLHAVRVAEALGIGSVLIPRSAGVGSAVGFLNAPISYEVARSLPQRLDRLDAALVNRLLDEMAAEAGAVVRHGAPDRACLYERSCLARYVGQGYEIPVPLGDLPLDGDPKALLEAFETVYRDHYGGVTIGLPVEVLTWRVRARTEPDAIEKLPDSGTGREIKPAAQRQVIDAATGEKQAFGLFHRAEMRPGDWLQGPALIVEQETTTVVSPRFDARIDGHGCILLTKRGAA